MKKGEKYTAIIPPSPSTMEKSLSFAALCLCEIIYLLVLTIDCALIDLPRFARKHLGQIARATQVARGTTPQLNLEQHLAYLDAGKSQLHYWLMEGKSNYAEVDHVMTVDFRMRSGDAVKDVKFELLSLPLYAVESLPFLDLHESTILFIFDCCIE